MIVHRRPGRSKEADGPGRTGWRTEKIVILVEYLNICFLNFWNFFSVHFLFLLSLQLHPGIHEQPGPRIRSRLTKFWWSWSGLRFQISSWTDRFWFVDPCLHRFLRQSKVIFFEMLDFLDFDFFDFQRGFQKSIFAESKLLSLNLRLVDLVIFSGIVVVISYWIKFYFLSHKLVCESWFMTHKLWVIFELTFEWVQIEEMFQLWIRRQMGRELENSKLNQPWSEVDLN